SCLQAKLSPVDTEMGLALDVDLADLAGVTGGSTEAGFGVVHPGLGSTIAQLRGDVRVGTHVFVEVDTSALHAYSVEGGPADTLDTAPSPTESGEPCEPRASF